MAIIQSTKQSLTIRLGSDLKFPILGNFTHISGLDLLLQDIQRLLLTIPGERPFRPTFGCGLRTLVWEDLETAQAAGRVAIINALQTFEPRITVTDVSNTVDENEGLITYNVQFIVNIIDTKINLVFPFRVGTQLSTSQS